MKKSFSLLLLGAIVWVAPSVSVVGAVLTSVPMQGGMVMPMLSYNASAGALQVQLDPTVPALIPLLVSNPQDHFDPADPWFNALDSSREGRAFSRRYGFVMNTVTDLLPAGTGIWIRKLSSSAQLGFYRAHGMSLPHRWEPLFGTDGTTNEFSWSGTMFHPCVTAPPGTDTYSATFEAFLVEAGTGVALPNSSTGPFTLTWTSVPDGRPVLTMAQKLVLAWPTSASNWVLECCDMGPASQWNVVTNSPVMVDGQPMVILDGRAGQMFYRMRLMP